MAGIKRTRYLTCFYCGRRTSTAYSSSIRMFECPNCDATNHLDENGEITDPPVATTSRESNSQYAVPKTSSHSASDPNSSDIFCDTCLKNQRLFTTSLSQYLPDDPDSPDYAMLEKKYYQFRNRLEERYPQICEDCEPRVQQRIEQAAYTAKTDTLRRMIDRSRKVQRVTERSWLNYITMLGRCLWFSGLLLQLLWHASLLRALVPEDAATSDIHPLADWGLAALDNVLSRLPNSEALFRLSLLSSLTGLWWNPYFVQTYRGFTKHIIGLRLWYTNQLLALFIRVVFRSLMDWGVLDPALTNTFVMAHSLTIGLTLYVYLVGPRSIRIDTRPLFGPSPKRNRTRPSAVQAARKEETQTVSQILDDILHEPTNSPLSRLQALPRPAEISSSFASRPETEVRGSFGLGPEPPQGELPLDSLTLARDASVGYAEEMDWTPTHSKHRAFRSQEPPPPPQPFGAADAIPATGNFWHRVPPAPVSPAHRLFNPPANPLRQRIPQKPKRDNPFARPNEVAAPGGPEDEGFRLAEPTFFAQPAQGDPRNSLSDLFGDSFSLAQEESGQRARAEQGEEGQRRRSKSWFGGGSWFG